MADTTVTGRIGDMDVALINAASEATMMKLLESMNALSNKMGGSPSSRNSTDANSPQGQNTAAVAASTTAYNKSGQAVGAFAGAIADATKGVMNFAGNLIGGTFLALKNLTKELFLGGDKVSDFTKHLANLPSVFGMLGTVVHGLSSYLENTVDTFRSLSQVGAGSTGSLTEMRIMAAASGMSLERFSKTVIANAESMALFGPTVSAGAKEFGRLSRDIRNSEAGTRLMNMGFSIDEINETLITYANINSRMGRDRTRSDTELMQRAAEFGEELNRAAAATGLSRKAIGDTANALSKDAVIQSIMRKLGPEQAAEFKVAISSFTAKFKESAPAVLDVLSGFYNSDEARAFVSQAPEMANTINKLKKGEITQLDFHNRMIEQAQTRQRQIEKMGSAEIAAKRLIPGFLAYERSIYEMASGVIKNQEQIDAEIANQTRGDKIDEIYKTFQNTLENFRAAFALEILDSQVFKTFQQSLNDLLNDGPKLKEILNMVVAKFKSFLASVNQFLVDWKKFNFKEALNKAIVNLFDIKDSELWTKPDKSGEQTAISPAEALINKVGGAMLVGIKNMFSSLIDAAIEGAKEHWVAITATVVGLFVGGKILGAMFGGGNKKDAGGGEFSAMKALGGSFAQAASWLMKGVAIGGSMVAIGYGLGKLAEGIAPFKDIDVESLGKAGATLTVLTGAIMVLGKVLTGPQLAGFAIGTGAIAALGLALNAFPTDVLDSLSKMMATVFAGVATNVEKVFNGIGNIIGKITEMRTAMAKATTDQIKELANIPSENMLAAAAGIDAIKKALDGFNPGFLGGLSEGLGSLFGKDKIGPLEKLAELGPKLGTAAPGFTAFSQAMGGGFTVVGLSLNPQQTRSIEILSKEMPAYAAGLQTVSMMGPNLQGTATALKAFVEASQGVDLNKFIFSKEQSANLVDGTNKLKNLAVQLSNASKEFKKLDETGLKKIKEGVEGLSKAFKEFNESFIEKFLPKFEEMKSTTQEGLLTEVGSKLDTLNSNMSVLVGIERDSRGYLNTISTKSPGKVS
jgi:hypothetical protein